MRNFKIKTYRSWSHRKLLYLPIKHFSEIISWPKFKWKLITGVYLNLIVEFIMLYIVSFILHIQHLPPIHRDHFLAIHIPSDFKRSVLHHIRDIVNLCRSIRVTIHLPPLLHPILTPVLHLEYDPLVTPLSYLDLGSDHVLRLEAEGGGGAEPPMLHDVHIVH